MKIKKIYAFIIFISLFLLLQCHPINKDEPVAQPREDILFVWGLESGVRDYTIGDKFKTTGNNILVEFIDNSREIIRSGFTHEASLGPPSGIVVGGCNIEINEWEIDPSVWFSIKHGDPLPVKNPPSVFTEFYVRAVYMGMRSLHSTITVRP